MVGRYCGVRFVITAIDTSSALLGVDLPYIEFYLFVDSHPHHKSHVQEKFERMWMAAGVLILNILKESQGQLLCDSDSF